MLYSYVMMLYSYVMMLLCYDSYNIYVNFLPRSYMNKKQEKSNLDCFIRAAFTTAFYNENLSLWTLFRHSRRCWEKEKWTPTRTTIGDLVTIDRGCLVGREGGVWIDVAIGINGAVIRCVSIVLHRYMGRRNRRKIMRPKLRMRQSIGGLSSASKRRYTSYWNTRMYVLLDRQNLSIYLCMHEIFQVTTLKKYSLVSTCFFLFEFRRQLNYYGNYVEK